LVLAQSNHTCWVNAGWVLTTRLVTANRPTKIAAVIDVCATDRQRPSHVTMPMHRV